MATIPFSRVWIALAGDASDQPLEARARLVAALLPGISFRETRAAAVLDQVSETDLVLVGAPDDERRGRRWIAELAMGAPCSIWMAPTSAPPRLSRLLVAVDLSDRSAEALSVAAQMAQTASAESCRALHVRADAHRLSFDEADPVASARVERSLATFIARVDEQGVDVEAVVVESANIPGAIVRAADEHASDLIVMSTRGRTRAAALLLPSTCREVLLTSAVPVLALKCHGARLGALAALRDPRLRARGDLRFG